MRWKIIFAYSQADCTGQYNVPEPHVEVEVATGNVRLPVDGLPQGVQVRFLKQPGKCLGEKVSYRQETFRGLPPVSRASVVLLPLRQSVVISLQSTGLDALTLRLGRPTPYLTEFRLPPPHSVTQIDIDGFIGLIILLSSIVKPYTSPGAIQWQTCPPTSVA